MPGILPMKVIKVGSNATARIAQACDRCRSKKIRCDGIRPSCTQCTNVGFECKTSDKLSRRAFPRGYTESLEERVRALELEVRELKELLDEKDEKIDLLSRLHSHSHSPQAANSTPRRTSTSPSPSERVEAKQEKEDTFKVHQAPLLLDDEESSDAYYAGGSSGRTLVEAFKQRAQETGRSCSDVNSGVFFGAGSKSSVTQSPKRAISYKAPPRLVSDQMVNIFFQEWAPVFPVLHRPTFLTLYEEYVASPDSLTDKKSIAQLNLVFGIAALSSDPRDGQDVESFEAQWQSAVESFLMDNDVATLQCLVLAQIFCLIKADYSRLLKYKGLAVALSQRLGLHQSQKRFALGALTSETRKKVFWSLYTVDCLSAAHLGLPKLLREEDVHCEYPVDADDEYVTEKGFLPTLPGEFTKLSSALALFRVSRILAKVLAELYPASPSHEISFRTIASLSDELEEWSTNLSPHLKLTFQQDKPSTNVTSSRSPILSLAYHHIRALIYRPAVIANLGDKGSSAIVAVGDACKHMVQIIQLLDERKLSFSFCLNRNEVLVQAGFGLLFQTLNLDRDGKLIKDCNRLVCSVIEMLERGSAAGSHEFRRVGCSMISIPRVEMPIPTLSRHNSEASMNAPLETFRATQKSLKAIAARFSPAARANRQESETSRRATLPAISPGMHANPSSTSLSSIRSEPPVARSEPAFSPLSGRSSLSVHTKRRTSSTVRPSQNPNIDYLSFGPDPLANYHFATNHHNGKPEVSSQDWERLLSSLDNGQTNIYDTIYGGQTADALLDCPPMSAGAEASLAWSPDVWSWDMTGAAAPPPQSVLSFSDESLTSGEEFANCGAGDYGQSPTGSHDRIYQGIMIPDMSTPNSGMGLGGLDGTFL
ncbi:transcriptional activator protein-like protein acu-15 [Aaosphaeria arxii CBS 175.79]|uniref:Transcriptional activator protein-like protein acu-15 n=1 Tax=Aaosphaeria arxii CBS 175.79 TaxID=1450172 RepID=A0A6A5XQE6_9PLEO|nr:transcriptional activator protein-like protein acu-15 [Aaosphaeria arxii CBS 175.79]KAF2015057.1 transcriptional activator protein-like protein acu-15 [Aaosphaeria arxii CBS 175.79]